jgi:hypothetical protein
MQVRNPRGGAAPRGYAVGADDTPRPPTITLVRRLLHDTVLHPFSRRAHRGVAPRRVRTDTGLAQRRKDPKNQRITLRLVVVAPSRDPGPERRAATPPWIRAPMHAPTTQGQRGIRYEPANNIGHSRSRRSAKALTTRRYATPARPSRRIAALTPRYAHRPRGRRATTAAPRRNATPARPSGQIAGLARRGPPLAPQVCRGPLSSRANQRATSLMTRGPFPAHLRARACRKRAAGLASREQGTSVKGRT